MIKVIVTGGDGGFGTIVVGSVACVAFRRFIAAAAKSANSGMETDLACVPRFPKTARRRTNLGFWCFRCCCCTTSCRDFLCVFIFPSAALVLAPPPASRFRFILCCSIISISTPLSSGGFMCSLCCPSRISMLTA